MKPRQAEWRQRVGVVLSSVALIFLLLDGLGKLLAVSAVLEGAQRLGYPAGLTRPLGAILLTCVVIHLVPRTSALGALLLTGYLGGAVATHLRVGSPRPTHVLFPVYVGVLIWGGLVLRRADLRHALLAASPRRTSTVVSPGAGSSGLRSVTLHA